MSQDGTPDPRDQGSTGEPTQPAEWVLPPDGQSRRHFLRNALIGSAAAAAVVGGGAAVAASPLGPKIISKIRPVTADASPNDPFGMCFEESMLPGSSLGCIQVFTNNKGKIVVNPGSFWIIFTANNLAVTDTYSVKIEQSTDGGATKSLIDGSTTTPFIFAENNVYYAVGGSAYATCPNSNPGAAHHPPTDPVTGISASAGQSLIVLMHLQWNTSVSSNVPSGSETITFYGTLSNTGGTVATRSTSVVAQNAACP